MIRWTCPSDELVGLKIAALDNGLRRGLFPSESRSSLSTFRESASSPQMADTPPEQNAGVVEQSPQSPTFSQSGPGNEFSHRDGDHDDWSGADSEDAAGRKRKRPMSVSCELCKQRKVKCESITIFLALGQWLWTYLV